MNRTDYNKKHEIEKEKEKQFRYINVLTILINGYPMCDTTIQECFTLRYENRDNYSSSEKIFDLMKFRDYLRANEHLYIGDNERTNDIMNGCDRIPKFLVGKQRIRCDIDGYYYNFSELLDLFHKEFPQSVVHEVRASINTIKTREDQQINAILKINDKLDTIQKFEAQVADKLTVFAEMIDDIKLILENINAKRY